VATLAQRYGALIPRWCSRRASCRLRARITAGPQGGERVHEAFASRRPSNVRWSRRWRNRKSRARAGPHRHPTRPRARGAGQRRDVSKSFGRTQQAHRRARAQSTNDVNGIDIRIVEPPLVRCSFPARSSLLLPSRRPPVCSSAAAWPRRAGAGHIGNVGRAAEATLGLPVLATCRARGIIAGPPAWSSVPRAAHAERFVRCAPRCPFGRGGGARGCSRARCPARARRSARSTCRRLRTAGIARAHRCDLRRPSLMRLFSDPNEQTTLSACMRDPPCSRRPCSHANRNLFRLATGQRSRLRELMARSGLRDGSTRRRLLQSHRDRSAPLMAVRRHALSRAERSDDLPRRLCGETPAARPPA